MSTKIRVRFAPSPTGPLHMGGVRTALYNYLFAKKHGGDFILRIEDTDQNRYVPGAEEYIIEALKWCGIMPNEGVGFGDGPHAPYRQSERKDIYKKYADQLIASGHAYYAFDSEEELTILRTEMEAVKSSFAYNAITRKQLINSLTLSKAETDKRLSGAEHYVIRLKVPENEDIHVKDIIRGDVSVHTSQMDDKVLFKSDGMPTYHLANVVDDYLMKITHVIRGEEWLPSAPLHVLLYRSFGWENVMPQFAHLPLLLKPEGNGKLSKRDGDRLGFPVFPLRWVDPATREESSGYREKEYYPEAFTNMLALLGWHPSGDKEIYSMEELIEDFSLERVNKSGAKFDPEKTKWFNQHYLRLKPDSVLADHLKSILRTEFNFSSDDHRMQDDFLLKAIPLLKERVQFEHEMLEVGRYLLFKPTEYDQQVISKKWKDSHAAFFRALLNAYENLNDFNSVETEKVFQETAVSNGLKPGEVLQLFRVFLSGQGGGVNLFGMAELLGKQEVLQRLKSAMAVVGVELNA
ncbi:MAG: glutamate--tRNA ligase [Bacteroidetes bacterium]|nr:MAG: glutamate--tRNA ligase [Bacteroidota bacterium]